MNEERQPATSEVQLNTRTAVGVFDNLEQAKAAAECLEQAGYRDAISIVSPRGKPVDEGAEETRATSGGLSGVAAGAIFGGLALAAIAIAVPGVGTVIAGGPLVAGLAGAFGGASAGGLVGSFVGLGVTTEHARRYEQAVRQGRTVVTVDTAGRPEAETACDLMRGSGAMQVASYEPML